MPKKGYKQTKEHRINNAAAHTIRVVTKPYKLNSHGMCRTRIYKKWNGMIQRCNNPKSGSYSRYGAIGITVCDKWLLFDGFYEDMKDGYIEGLSLDRINPHLGYYKENCRWVELEAQYRNRRDMFMLTIDGVTKELHDWLHLSPVCAHTIRCRVYRGWNHKDALFKPQTPAGENLKTINGKRDATKRASVQLH